MFFNKIENNEEFTSRPIAIKQLLKWSVLWEKRKSFRSLLNFAIAEDCVIALHDAIYYGKLEPALEIIHRFPEITTLRLEGYDVIQLSARQNKHAKFGNLSTIYTWGKNIDYVLGYNKEHSKLHNVLHGEITVFSMGKSHAICCTKTNVYVWGTGRRLGLKSNNTAIYPQIISNITIKNSDEEIVSLALGRDHSVLVRRNGSVCIFGDNSYGQCGVALKIETDFSGDFCSSKSSPSKLSAGSLKKLDHFISPFTLKTSIKKEFIIGAAASKVHTLLFSNSSLYAFGLNNGQLGYPTFQKNDSEVSWIPRYVNLSSAKYEIIDAACTDEVSLVLIKSSQGSDIMLLKDFIFTKIRNPYMNITSSLIDMKRKPEFSMIKSKFLNHEKHSLFGTVCEQGHLYANIIIRNSQDRPHLVKVWHAGEYLKRVVDFDFGNDGTVLLCTKERFVYKGVLRPKSITSLKSFSEFKVKIYKFHRITHICNAVKVVASPKGAFGYISRSLDLEINPPIPSSKLSMFYESRFVEKSNFICLSFDNHKIYLPPHLTNIFDFPKDSFLIEKWSNLTNCQIEICNDPTGVTFTGFRNQSINLFVDSIFGEHCDLSRQMAKIKAFTPLEELFDKKRKRQQNPHDTMPQCGELSGMFPDYTVEDLDELVLVSYEFQILKSLYPFETAMRTNPSEKFKNFSLSCRDCNILFHSSLANSKIIDLTLDWGDSEMNFEVASNILHSFHDFLLTRKAALPMEDLCDLLYISEYLMVDSHLIQHEICKQVSIQNILQLLSNPICMNCDYLRNFCYRFILQNLGYFLEIPDCINLLKHPELIEMYHTHIKQFENSRFMYQYPKAQELVLFHVQESLLSSSPRGSRKINSFDSKFDLNENKLGSSFTTISDHEFLPDSTLISPIQLDLINEPIFPMDQEDSLTLPEPLTFEEYEPPKSPKFKRTKRKSQKERLLSSSPISPNVSVPKPTWKLSKTPTVSLNSVMEEQLAGKKHWEATVSPVLSLDDIIRQQENAKVQNEYRKPLHLLELEDKAEKEIRSLYLKNREPFSGQYILLKRIGEENK
eukprot:NODE_698_length_4656_cov_1.141321.p1 type:complete len:1058 gc:universal NODE_698_length_4656_cov_1.141321:3365-192(-)